MNDRDRERGREERVPLKIIIYIKFVLLCITLKIYWDKKNALKYVNAQVIKMPFCTVSVQRG